MIGLSNAAGTVKLVEQAEKLGRAPVNEVVIGSYTLEPRTGNEGHVYWSGEDSKACYALNRLGLPNPGIQYVVENKNKLAAAHDRIVVSIAGFRVEEYAELAAEIEDWAYAIEINLGCPNVAGHDIGSFDPSFSAAVVKTVCGASSGVQVRVKLSPYSNPRELQEMLAVLDGIVWPTGPCAYVLSNTFPNCWAIDKDGKEFIGGLSGAAVKPIVLGQIKQASELTDRTLIAAGGVTHGWDLSDYEAAGASMVQVGSHYLDHDEDPGVFGDLLQEAV
jgi:dihydroorotate dehydrogenase